MKYTGDFNNGTCRDHFKVNCERCYNRWLCRCAYCGATIYAFDRAVWMKDSDGDERQWHFECARMSAERTLVITFDTRREAEDRALELRRTFPRAGVREVGVLNFDKGTITNKWRVELD